jgi:hypothetical protein
VSAIENSKLKVIPSVTIMRFIDEIRLTNRFNGICTIVGKFTKCDFELTENNKQYGVLIEDNYDINYNNYDYKDKHSYMNPRKNDIIVKIEDSEITKTGKIYDKCTGVELDFQTYLALNFTCGDTVSMTILRCNKKRNDDYKEKKIVIRARPIESMKYVQITFNGLIVDYKGFLFIEMSEDIILNYYNLGIDIGQFLDKYLIVTPYRNEQEHIVVLIDIDKNRISKKNLDIVNTTGLPLMNKTEKYYMIPILKKINKKRIFNLKDLKQSLSQEEDRIFRFAMCDLSRVKILDKHVEKELEIKFTV